MKNIAVLPVVSGALIGIIASLMVLQGNPGNMGICVACFTRDTAGALGFHRAEAVQYIRPEIIGLILGAFAASFFFGEFRPRAGSAPIVRFFLGIFAMIGALVFLGCPWRAYLRLSGGDWNALAGIAGLVGGVLAGTLFLKKGFSLGRNRKTYAFAGLVTPFLAAVLLLLLITGFQSGVSGAGAVFFSKSGPGSLSAPLAVSLLAGLIIGVLAQRSRFCTIAAVRDAALLRDGRLLQGIIALIIGAFVTNLIAGQFRPGFINQPIAHTDALWNFSGMALSGLAFTLAGGCPGRQMILSGEGDSDAAVFILGMGAGAALAHNFNLASSSAGVSAWGPHAVLIGMAFCVILGFSMREKI